MKVLAVLTFLLIALSSVRGLEVSTHNPFQNYAICLYNSNILYNLCNQQVGNWPPGTLPPFHPGVVFCNTLHFNYNNYCLAVFLAAIGVGGPGGIPIPCTGPRC